MRWLYGLLLPARIQIVEKAVGVPGDYRLAGKREQDVEATQHATVGGAL